MRRKDREVHDINVTFDIVEKCNVVRLAMVDAGKPYLVALNFGYDRQGDELIMYFHSAMEGRKMDILRKDPEVFFEMDTVNEFIRGTQENPCKFCWRFDSVMGSGKVEFITDEAQKVYALNRLIQHLDHDTSSYVFPEDRLARTNVYKVVSSDITGKHHE